MSDSHLTQEQARTLLEKLARDDSFRALFETAPARALKSLGADSETIVQLPAACLQWKTLAPKDVYEDLLETCSDTAIASAMQMTIPHVGFRER